jgi:NitT/TauT family transport system permease protein
MRKEERALAGTSAKPLPVLADSGQGPVRSSGSSPSVAPPGGGMVHVLAPAVAGTAALFLHKLLPDRQIALTTTLYPLLLEVFLGAAVFLAVSQGIWRRFRPGVRHYGPLLAGVAVWLAAWDLLTLKFAVFKLPHFPNPEMVLQAIWGERSILLASAYSSLQRLAAGYFGGAALGLTAGILMGWFRDVRYWGVPVMKVIGPIPATALIPTAIVLFGGSSALPGVALIAFAVSFPVMMLTMSGIINVPASYFDVARTLGAGRGYLIFRVAIPAAMPSIFIGLFMGLLSSFLVLAVAEAIGVKDGLGWYVEWRRSAAEYDRVFGAIFIMSLFFSGIMTLLFKVRDRVLSWQKGVIRW